MLGLYLDNIIILQYVKYPKWNDIAEGIAIFHDKMFLIKQNKNAITIKQKGKDNTVCQNRELNQAHVGPQSDALLSRQLSVSIVVNLLNCFNVTSRNINKQIQICGPRFSTIKSFFVNILTCTDNYFSSFSYKRSKIYCFSMVKK